MHYTRVSVYALMLAAAGIPLYIHLPQFASSNLGIGLGTIGLILLLIRLIDPGSGLIDHIQKMMIAAIAIADMNVWSQRS